MKILIIAPHYKPGYKAGGPIQSIYNLSKLIGAELEVFVFTQSNDFGEENKLDVEEDKWITLENHQVQYCNKNNFNVNTILKIVSEINPSYVYFNSLFSSLTWKTIIKNFISPINSHMIIAPRGELDPGALKIKALKKAIFIKIFRLFIKTNTSFHATTELEKNNISRFFNAKIFVAENVPNIITVKPQKDPKFENETNFVFISRISPKKNLLYCLEIFSLIEPRGTINFDIIGPLEDKEYWSEIEKKIAELKNSIRVNYVGEIPNHLLLEKTKKYHYLFFPTKAENYGHIIYESLSFGIPVILSDQTPWEENNNGIYTKKLEDKDEFVNIVNKLHSLNNEKYSLLSNQAYEYAKNKVNKNKLIKSYKNLFNANNQK